MLDHTIVPQEHINLFLNNSLYANNGFTMLNTLVATLQPSHAKTLLEAIKQLYRLSMEALEYSQLFEKRKDEDLSY